MKNRAFRPEIEVLCFSGVRPGGRRRAQEHGRGQGL